MNARHEFVMRAMEPNANLAELCRDAGISRKTAYKWLLRFREKGIVGLKDMSRRPRGSSLRATGERRAIAYCRHPRYRHGDERFARRPICRDLDRSRLRRQRARRRSQLRCSYEPGASARRPVGVVHLDPRRATVEPVELHWTPHGFDVRDSEHGSPRLGTMAGRRGCTRRRVKVASRWPSAPRVGLEWPLS